MSFFPPCSCNNCARCFGDALERSRAVRGWPPGFVAFAHAFAETDTPRAIETAWALVRAIEAAERERIACVVDRDREATKRYAPPGDYSYEDDEDDLALAKWLRDGAT